MGTRKRSFDRTLPTTIWPAHRGAIQARHPMAAIGIQALTCAAIANSAKKDLEDAHASVERREKWVMLVFGQNGGLVVGRRWGRTDSMTGRGLRSRSASGCGKRQHTAAG